MTWEETGLLEGLSEEHKKLCSFAFTVAFNYVFYIESDDELKLSFKTTSLNEVLEKKEISVNDIKMVFGKNRSLETSLEVVLFPMIRRVIERTGKKLDVPDFVKHCRNHYRTFDIEKYLDRDWEAELCKYLSETY